MSLAKIRQDRKVMPFPASDRNRWWENMATAVPEQRQRVERKTEETRTTRESAPVTNLSEKAEKLKDDMDRIIDEIDQVLEENAEEFVRNYVQRGGQ